MQAMNRVLDPRALTRRHLGPDVIRDGGRSAPHSLLPDELTLVTELEFLDDTEVRLWSQVQGSGCVHLRKGVGAAITHAMLGTVALEDPEASVLARALPGKSRWAVVALNCHFELFAQTRAARQKSDWRREDARTTLRQKDRAVEEFVTLLLAVDAVLQRRAGADTCEFLAACRESSFTPWQQVRLAAQMLRASRWQHLVRALRHPDFQSLLEQLTTPVQHSWIEQALRPIVGPFGAAG